MPFFGFEALFKAPYPHDSLIIKTPTQHQQDPELMTMANPLLMTDASIMDVEKYVPDVLVIKC